MTETTPDAPGVQPNRWDTSRTEAFSDGVFAIAITLLILDVHIPKDGFDDLRQSIIDQWPSYLAYATSFTTIGGIWLAHHGMFRRLQYIDDRITRLNLLLLMAVSFLPFPTGLMAEAIHNDSAEHTAVIFYGTNLLVISIILSVMWRTVAQRPQLLVPGVTQTEVRAIMRRANPNLGAYFGVILLAHYSPQAAAYGYLIVAVAATLRVRGEPHGRGGGFAGRHGGIGEDGP